MALIERLAADHRSLEIDGRRTFAYQNIYFDSETFASYRSHVQGRRRRFKVRSRRYVESGTFFLEVKLKGRMGQTVKRRMPYDAASHGTLTSAAEAFIRSTVGEAYGREPGEPLIPVLGVDYRRITLVAADGSGRATLDYDLTFAGMDEARARLAGGYVVIETKTRSQRPGAVDRVLLTMGLRPRSPLSKYLLAVALVRQGRGSNEFRRLLRHFDAPAFVTTAP